MANISHHRNALVARVLDGDGKSSSQQRRDAFAGTGPDSACALIEKVTKHAYKVTDEDIAAAKAAGFTEDQIFELVVCAAVGQANRQLDGALAALTEATKE
jgi:alkylhydroperoxidase family enzyme